MQILEWSVMYLWTRGHGSGLIMWAFCLGAVTHSELKWHLYSLGKTLRLEVLSYIAWRCLPILSNDHCCLWLFLLLALQTPNCNRNVFAVQVCLALHCFSWQGNLISWCSLFLSPPLFFSLPHLVSLCLSPSLSDMQLAGRGSKENKCSMKAVEEMLESMQITMS